ncbi:MAG TPA: hypothetical protein VF388_07260 [Lacunisphaera sp.]
MAKTLLFSLGILLGSVLGAEPLAPAWQAAAAGLNGRAEKALASVAPGRDRELTDALLLLNQSPVTDAHIAEADAKLVAVAAGNAHDDTALAARYYLGRIRILHSRRPDPVSARQVFLELWQRDRGSSWGQRALLQIALIDLYGEDDFPPAARVEWLESEGAKLTLPEARRDFHLALSDYYLAARRPADPAAGLRHLLEGEAAGALSPLQVADTWIKIARLAQLLGDREMARHYYEEFVGRFVRDNRLTFARQQLQILGGSEP